MLRFAAVIFALCLAAITPAQAQTQQCLCTAASNGCDITADPYAGGVDTTPTYCSLYNGVTLIATAPLVASSTIPIANTGRCLPANINYVAGPASNVSCLVHLPPQPVGNVTVSLVAGNASGESVSAPFTFTNVAFLPKRPPATTNIRIARAEDSLDELVYAGIALAALEVGLRYHDLEQQRA